MTKINDINILLIQTIQHISFFAYIILSDDVIILSLIKKQYYHSFFYAFGKTHNSHMEFTRQTNNSNCNSL